ncbi:MAG TPA: HepT-like ribonuclease domain-containing protein [Thermoanaerobaculia bacterium]|jgi:uncharacterized protein YutE (UPF0331/DUF86 family)
MSHLVERLTELRRHLDHLRQIRPFVQNAAQLRQDLTLHNDVLFSLLTVCQLVIDISAELGARRGLRFEDYTEAVRNLSAFAEFPGSLVSVLERLPGFRNVLIHEYVALDLDRVIQALDQLQPVENFLGIVIRLESEEGDEEA